MSQILNGKWKYLNNDDVGGGRGVNKSTCTWGHPSCQRFSGIFVKMVLCALGKVYVTQSWILT